VLEKPDDDPRRFAMVYRRLAREHGERPRPGGAPRVLIRTPVRLGSACRGFGDRKRTRPERVGSRLLEIEGQTEGKGEAHLRQKQLRDPWEFRRGFVKSHRCSRGAPSSSGSRKRYSSSGRADPLRPFSRTASNEVSAWRTCPLPRPVCGRAATSATCAVAAMRQSTWSGATFFASPHEDN